jgi:UDP-N-acetyl-2-amino-2-deoxyglucuronate dehydrogenase
MTARLAGAVAVIGAGMASAPHLRSLAELGVDVRWVITRSPERARAVAQWLPKAAVAPDVGDALNDPEIACVLLLTPPATHLPLIEMAAQAGKAIIVEKPLELNVSRARAAVEACERAGMPLAVVHQHRFRLVVPRLKALLEAGALGPLHAIEVRVPWWRAQSYYDEPGRGTFARDGGGVMITQAIHVLDLMLHLCGPAHVLAARTRTSAVHKMEAEDLAVALLEWDCGAVGTLLASTAHRPGFPDSILLAGRDGTVMLEGERFRHWDARGNLVEESEAAMPARPPAHAMDFPHDAHRRLLEATLTAIAQRLPVPVSGRDAIAVLELIAAIEAKAAGHSLDAGEKRGVA